MMSEGQRKKYEEETGHRLDRCEPECTDVSCPVCIGGLAICTICCGAECSLVVRQGGKLVLFHPKRRQLGIICLS